MGGRYVSDSTVLRQLGDRLAALRLAQNLTQAEVAEQAGVSKRTVERLEAGATASQLSTFLRVCRVLGLQDRLDQLVPEPTASPVAQLRQQRQTRKRASGRQEDAQAPSTTWTWEP
ncbi:helix-turn-helix transcriptional regulator [Coralloluteibacterium stylophorae]|uniref:Helix-turn-helix transcriptional regulator n=1 Tax=Coralloluteibacterium stylophorae TaxID=1776034 RepID=A0A8J8AY77_9GAMM|nr:helix-turn-helix transcriptional regulator [Coralloluteibacterium stylophorae]MBS7455703.1 helix-turn-helix transcriptional regulator [Coralloluteibacterium stylophorae]